jgi:hypothetical protein
VFSGRDRELLRELAWRTAEIAELEVQAQRRELWKRHNSLEPGRPLLLVFPEGSWLELLPFESICCEHPMARFFEMHFRNRIYYHEHFCDDTVIEREWIVNKAIGSSGWGLEPRLRHSGAARGAWGFDPVIHEPADLEKLRFPEIAHHEAETQRHLEIADELFGDILEIILKDTHTCEHNPERFDRWLEIAREEITRSLS